MGVFPYLNVGEGATTRRPARGAPNAARLQVMAVLSAIFNCLALNLALIVACVPIVTAPAAFQAAIVALDRWRDEGEDRVVREFVAVLRSRPLLPAVISGGVPLVAVAIALKEVYFFSRGGTIANWLCLGLGVDALLLAVASFGYALVLAARRPELPATDLWYMAISLAVRNLLWASPLLIAESVAVVGLAVADPALALVGLPLAWLGLVRRTVAPAIRRAEQPR